MEGQVQCLGSVVTDSDYHSAQQGEEWEGLQEEVTLPGCGGRRSEVGGQDLQIRERAGQDQSTAQ